MRPFAVLLLALFGHLYSPCQCFEPNIGDIRLYNSQGTWSLRGELQIYITDGSSPLGWSRVCKTLSFGDEEAKVSCKQLGLPDGRIISESDGSQYPKKITDIECGRYTGRRHILQCEHRIGDYLTSCPYTVFIECRNSTLFADIPPGGELKLCPPDNTNSNLLTSTSFGVVMTYIYHSWKAIGNSTVSIGSSNLADLMCSSMGYQKSVPGSIMTAKALYDNYTFSSCNNRVADSSWLNLSQLTYDSTRQYPCFGCFMEFPGRQACSKRSCVDDFIVIQCVFDPLHVEVYSTTDMESCLFSEDAKSGDKILNYSSICHDKLPSQWNTYSIAFGGAALLELVIIIALLMCLIIYCCIRKYCKNGCKIGYREMSKQPNGQN